MNTYETGGGQAAVAEAALPKEVSRGYREEIEHWAWCIKNPDPRINPSALPKVALADAVIALTSNIAMKKGGTNRIQDRSGSISTATKRRKARSPDRWVSWCRPAS